MSTPLVETSALTKHFRAPARSLFGRREVTRALDGIDISISRGESVAIVGESGSGKSTLLRLLLGLSNATSGTVRFDGRPVDPAKDKLMWLRQRTGIVFQDPYSSFDPRRTVGQTVAEPLIAAGGSDEHNRAVVAAMLARLELPENAPDRYPEAFSGGQRQRLAIARALIHRPELMLADEPVSALDVLVRGRILRLLTELREELGLTLVTVTHDLSIVDQLAERVIVMRAGRVVETGPTEAVLGDPQEPYTRELIASLPRLQ